MNDSPNSKNNADSECCNKAKGNLSNNKVTLYVKQTNECIDGVRMKDTLDDSSDRSKSPDDETMKCVDREELKTDSKRVESVEHFNCEKDISDKVDTYKGSEGHVSPVRVSSTAFSVSDILDPKKFTGCQIPGNSVHTLHLQSWLSRKRRHTDEIESGDDKLIEDGQYTAGKYSINNS